LVVVPADDDDFVDEPPEEDPEDDDPEDDPAVDDAVDEDELSAFTAGLPAASPEDEPLSDELAAAAFESERASLR